MVVCITVLVCGLIGSLLLNTLMAQGSYEQSQLQRQISEQAQQQDSLQTDLDALTTPEHLAGAAADLGMVQQQAPLIIRLSDRKVIGLKD